MRVLILVLFMSMVACGKKSDGAADAVTCVPYTSQYMVTYPDGVERKSSVATCSDGDYKVTSDDQAAPESFSADRVIIKLYDAQTGVPYHTTFSNQ